MFTGHVPVCTVQKINALFTISGISNYKIIDNAIPFVTPTDLMINQFNARRMFMY